MVDLTRVGKQGTEEFEFLSITRMVRGAKAQHFEESCGAAAEGLLKVVFFVGTCNSLS
jgi:hypothetical protein